MGLYPYILSKRRSAMSTGANALRNSNNTLQPWRDNLVANQSVSLMNGQKPETSIFN